jgi:hypothetical protein
MRRLLIMALAVTAMGCAGTYKPAAEGPTISLRVEPDVKAGVPLISYSDMSLYMDQIDGQTRRDLGWQKIPADEPSETFILPADKPIELQINYHSGQLFGPTLSGSQTFVLIPEAGGSYVMRFWTDKQHFSVKLLQEKEPGNLVPARVIARN